MGFIRTQREGSIAPRDGGKPLTVVEFSLTKDIRNKLKVALKPFVNGHRQDTDALGGIIKEHLPPEVLKELEVLGKESGSPHTVYVIKNLPEIDWDDVPTEFHNPYNRAKLSQWVVDNVYMRYIGDGVGQAIGLQVFDGDVVMRYSSDGALSGGNLHKHDKPVSSLGCIVSDGAPTRFTDMLTLLEQVEHNSGLARLKMEGRTEDDKKMTFPLGEIKNVYPDWQEQTRLGLTPDTAHNAAFEKLVARHSLEVTTKSGDLILWANKGRVFHQAMPSEQAMVGLRRIAYVNDYHSR